MITSSDENNERASARPIQRVAVLGAGTLGHGIAQIAAAAAGYAVIMRDVNSDALDRGSETFRPPEILRRMVSEGKLGRKSGAGFYKWNEQEMGQRAYTT